MPELHPTGQVARTSPGHTEKIWSVLIADDDPILRAVAESYFRSRDAVQVACASNRSEALRHIDSQDANVDFIWCDLNRPEMDGVQLLRMLKLRDFKGPIAILSGEHETVLSLARHIAQKHDLNIVGALNKPLNFDDLDRLILTSGSHLGNLEPVPVNVFTASELRSAIANDEIVVHYQPKICMATGRIAGAEALARWNRPDLGIIGPEQFIALAENSDLIEDLTGLILRPAIEDAARWRRLRLKFKVAVNISVNVLTNLSLPDDIAAQVDAKGLRRSDFIFEIAESRLAEENAIPVEVLARLGIMGFDLSIDDFGTGYSNIEHLQEYPFNELKIDRSFVHMAASNARAKASVEATVALARNLGLRIVAEGVETRDDWDYISRVGVDEVQGFLIAKPMPMDALLEWYFKYRAKCSNGHPCFF